MFFQKLADQSQKSDPRVEFWKHPDAWPRDSLTHLFLANVVQLVGAGIYGEAWEGTEAHVELVQPLPEVLNVYTPQADQIRAAELLIAHDEGYRQRSSVYGGITLSAPVMTEAEWAIARQLADKIVEANSQAYRRFVDVCSRLAFEFRNGLVLTATRGFDGGPEVYRSRDFWNTEHIWNRFDCCQVDPNNFFSPLTVRANGLLLFVERESLFARLTPPNEVHDTEKPAATARGVPQPLSIVPAGRPEKYDWPDFFGGAASVLMSEPRPESLRKFTSRMLEWCSVEWGQEPSESQARDKLKKLWDRVPKQTAADKSDTD